MVDTLGAGLFALSRTIRSLRAPLVRQAPSDPNQILIVQLDHLGDAIISLPMLRALRQRFPSACIDVLCAAWNQEWFESLAEVDNVRVLKSNRFARNGRGRFWFWIPALIGCGLSLRRRRYELAIDVRGEFPIALLLWLCGAQQRVGWDCGGGGFLLTHSAAYVRGRAESSSRWSLLRAIGIAPTEAPTRAVYDPGAAARNDIARRLAHLRVDGHPFVVVHIGAGTDAKRWPAPRWRELAHRLQATHNVDVILVGSSADRMTARRIVPQQSALVATIAGGDLRTRQTPPANIHDWTGTLTIRQLAALLERASLFVGADSGPAHLAAAVGAPTVVLFSGTNTLEQWRPMAARLRILRHDVTCSPCHRTDCPVAGHPCMQGITIDEALRACEDILGTTSTQRRPSPAARVAADRSAGRSCEQQSRFRQLAAELT
jgi:heptosyltransferase-2